MKQSLEDELNEQKADELLQNVFKATGREPNATPLSEISAQRESRLKGLNNARILAMCLLVLVLISPVAFRESFMSSISGPVVTEDLLVNGRLTLFLRDTGSGIDYDNIYARTVDGETVLPEKTSAQSQSVTFPVGESDLAIFIPSKTGKVAHIFFSKEKSAIRSRDWLAELLSPSIPKK